MKIVVNNATVIDAGSLAATANFTLPELFDFYGVALAITFTGTATGSVDMEVSVDGTTFGAYSGFTQITTLSGTSIWYLDNKIFPFQYARLKYVRTGNSGTMTVKMNACRV